MEPKDAFQPSQAETGISHERVTIVKRAPTFREVLGDSLDRSNPVYTKEYKRYWGGPLVDNPDPKQRTEREVIDDFTAFIEKIRADTRIRNEKFESAYSDLVDNLSFIGEPELKEAISGIAKVVHSDWEKGKKIIFYRPRGRSETYIILRVLEELKTQYGVGVLDYKQKEQRNPVSIAGPEYILNLCDPRRESVIYLLDDFLLSGTHMNTEASRLFEKLVASGFTPEQAIGSIKVAVVAMPDIDIVKERSRIEYNDQNTGELKEGYFELFSYFGIPEKSLGGIFGFFTSSFCAPDYSFTEIFKREIAGKFSVKPSDSRCL